MAKSRWLTEEDPEYKEALAAFVNERITEENQRNQEKTRKEQT